MASTYLSKTFSTPTSSKIFTFSFWVKKSQGSQSDDMHIFNNYVSGSSRLTCAIDGNENFKIENNNGAYNLRFITDAEYRDVNGFYHFVISVDTTQATESNRVKIYVNGVQETSFSTSTYPSQNDDIKVPDSSHTMYIGTFTGSAQFWDGSMAHVHFIDGTQYSASDFGETDSTTGIWKPKTAPSVTYGTNGFFLKFENSGSMGTDSSGNGNNFTVNGTCTQTIDTPSNVFATMNALDNYYPSATFSNGNTTTTSGAGNWTPVKSNLGVSSGKWYWEIKHSAVSSGGSYATIGIGSNQATGNQQRGGVNSTDYSYWYAGELRSNDSLQISVNTYGVGDIIGIALDLDNNKLYFSKNGTWQNSGDPTSGATGTGAMSITDPASTPLGQYFAENGFYDNTNTGTFQANFGNGYFGTTAVSSAQNPDDGIGIFEYDVPTGYRALCTKSINAQEYS